MSKKENIAQFIWGIKDEVLRGLFKPHEYGQVILPFTVLRRLDSVIESDKDKIIKLHSEWKKKVDDPTPIILNKIKKNFYNYSNYDLKRLGQDSQNINNNFKVYLNSFSKNVSDIIDNFEIEDPIKRLNENGRLFIFIEKFAQVDLSPSKISNFEMGQIFEELIRGFSEISNETSGEHYTPRDVIKLLVSLIFSENYSKLKKLPVVSIFDCCCGTGGMLTIAKETLHEEINKNIKTFLFGQELNPETYAICKSDMLITGDDPLNIRHGDSLDNDKFKDMKFQYMITNPPYGEDWKSAKEFILNESRDKAGRFFAGLPRITDGQLLFVQHLISKMDPTGSRIGIVLNGSPLFIGDAESGESEIRKYIIENDLLVSIIALPDQMFFNTGIPTYIWILSNKKSLKRKGKVQLIDAKSFYKGMRKSLNKKRKEITERDKEKILNLFYKFEENQFVKIIPNKHFSFFKLTVREPLTKNGSLMKDKKDKIIIDKSKRAFFERVSYTENIDEYLKREVYPNLPNAYIDRSKNKIGYDINFTKYFPPKVKSKKLNDIKTKLKSLEKNINKSFSILSDD